jgi:hypothetical protein
MPRYLFSLTEQPPPDEFAIDLPDDGAAIREAGFAQQELARNDLNMLICITIWDEKGRRVARIATAADKTLTMDSRRSGDRRTE